MRIRVNMMGALAACGILAGASTAAAGDVLLIPSAKAAPPALELPPLKPVCDCFDTARTGIDLFGAYVLPVEDVECGGLEESLGGGLGVTSYMNSYLGFSSSIFWWHDGESAVHSVNGSVILRYPIRSLCIAPYVVGGVGGHFNSVNQFTSHVGVGLEISLPQLTCLGFFAEGTYNFADETEDYAVFRLGTRYNF